MRLQKFFWGVTNSSLIVSGLVGFLIFFFVSIHYVFLRINFNKKIIKIEGELRPIEIGQVNYLIIKTKKFNIKYSVESINQEIKKLPPNSELNLFIYKKLKYIVRIKYNDKEIYNVTSDLKKNFNYNILYSLLPAIIFLWIFLKSIQMIKKT